MLIRTIVSGLAALMLGGFVFAQEPGKLYDGCWAADPCEAGLSCHPFIQKCYPVPRRLGDPCVAGHECANGLTCKPGAHVCETPNGDDNLKSYTRIKNDTNKSIYGLLVAKDKDGAFISWPVEAGPGEWITQTLYYANNDYDGMIFWSEPSPQLSFEWQNVWSDIFQHLRETAVSANDTAAAASEIAKIYFNRPVRQPFSKTIAEEVDPSLVAVRPVIAGGAALSVIDMQGVTIGSASELIEAQRYNGIAESHNEFRATYSEIPGFNVHRVNEFQKIGNISLVECARKCDHESKCKAFEFGFFSYVLGDLNFVSASKENQNQKLNRVCSLFDVVPEAAEARYDFEYSIFVKPVRAFANRYTESLVRVPGVDISRRAREDAKISTAANALECTATCAAEEMCFAFVFNTPKKSCELLIHVPDAYDAKEGSYLYPKYEDGSPVSPFDNNRIEVEKILEATELDARGGTDLYYFKRGMEPHRVEKQTAVIADPECDDAGVKTSLAGDIDSEWARRRQIENGRSMIWSFCDGGGLQFGADGNLYIVDDSGGQIWSADTWGRGEYVRFTSDGALAVFDANKNTVWTSGTGGQGESIRLENGGHLSILDAEGQPIWTAQISRYLDRFTQKLKAGIPAHNISSMTSTLEACHKACLDDRTCKSVDYDRTRDLCYLQDVAFWDQGISLKRNYPGDPYDHYSKNDGPN